ncbi:MAG: hypothetical protein K940chlam7_00961 [Chlamydiae bacterium]|nr:hypothetical protein [Chlamydiota bacterium]
MKCINLLISCLLLTGCCGKIGPQCLKYDSMAYNKSVQQSMDSQLLMNIVRLRYRDTPTFLQIGIMSSAYELKRNISAELKVTEGGSAHGPMVFIPKVGVDFIEKPTTTYQQLRGDNFVKELLSPIKMSTIAILQTSGWRIDRILRCCVQKMNGIQNAFTASSPTPDVMPQYREFLELCRLFRDVELQNGIDIIGEKEPKSSHVDYYLVLDGSQVNHSTLNRIWQLLDIEPGTERIRMVPYHGKKHQRDEIVIDTRSPLNLFYFLSQGVHVPTQHELCGKVTVTADSQGRRFNWDEVLDGIMTIHSGSENRCDVAAMVNYRGVNFYIDDRDLASKSTFSLVSQLLALQMGAPDVPILTIPLNN